jgi:AraC-like DNA-binding protein
MNEAYKDVRRLKMTLKTLEITWVEACCPLYTDSPLEAKKLSCIQFARLCTHYASLGGLSPAVGYNLELSYVKSIQAAKNAGGLLALQNDILDTFIQHVRQHKAALEQNISREIQMGCEYVLLHIESNLALEDIAAHASYTPYYFSRKFKQEMGMSINQYIKTQKIERSKTLLLTTDLSIQEIADKLSLCSATYLSSAFRSLVGCSPTAYRTGRGVNGK